MLLKGHNRIKTLESTHTLPSCCNKYITKRKDTYLVPGSGETGVPLGQHALHPQEERPLDLDCLRLLVEGMMMMMVMVMMVWVVVMMMRSSRLMVMGVMLGRGCWDVRGKMGRGDLS